MHSGSWGKRLGLAVCGLVLGVALAGAWSGRRGRSLYDGERAAQVELADGVLAALEADVGLADFATGGDLFDAEWWLVSWQFACLGWLQLLREHPEPELVERYLPAVERGLRELLRPEIAAFDARAWGEDPRVALRNPAEGASHIAWLGYLAAPFSLYRLTMQELGRAPDAELDAAAGQLLAALEVRYGSQPRILETYPGERYPVDNLPGIAAWGMEATRTGAAPGWLRVWLAAFRSRYREPGSGLLIQAVDGRHEAVDAARGSGSALAIYWLGYVDPGFSEELYQRMRGGMSSALLGFRVAHEYPGGANGRFGDVDSGPVLFNVGPSATGFLIAGARMHGDRRAFAGLHATAHLLGAPYRLPAGPGGGGQGLRWAMGGVIGDTLLLGLSTAPRLGASVPR